MIAFVECLTLSYGSGDGENRRRLNSTRQTHKTELNRKRIGPVDLFIYRLLSWLMKSMSTIGIGAGKQTSRLPQTGIGWLGACPTYVAAASHFAIRCTIRWCGYKVLWCQCRCCELPDRLLGSRRATGISVSEGEASAVANQGLRAVTHLSQKSV